MLAIEGDLVKPDYSPAKKDYIKPDIIHEMLLETRAGSEIPPFAPPGGFNPTLP